MNVKFLTWNIACGAAGYNGLDPHGIAECILKENIDVCALQEVDKYAMRSNFMDLPQYLSQITKMNIHFKRTIFLPPESTGLCHQEYGIAILSRFEITEIQEIDFSPLTLPESAHIWEKENRSAIISKLNINSKKIWVGCTHLAYSPNLAPSTIRQQQIQMLKNSINPHLIPQNPLILGGDFNTTLSNGELTPLSESLSLETYKIGPTWPLKKLNPQAAHSDIDHIFCHGLNNVKTYKINHDNISDHSMVIADFDLT
uniref:Metal-dependent hydrolase n=1 Tax=Desulfovibrio sp. U5L TaxID=596152 RepID=I2Q6I4_9BACT